MMRKTISIGRFQAKPQRLDRNMLDTHGAIKLANNERPIGLKISRILANAKKLRYA
jgi:hypothetical protein